MKVASKKPGRGIYTAPILVGLTPAQRAAVKLAAKRSRRSVAEWVRIILMDAVQNGARTED